MTVVYDHDHTDGSLIYAESVLRRLIGQHASRNRWIYIGLTQQKPKKRFAQHQRKWDIGKKWDRMIVIYKARNFALMHIVEGKLIKYAKEKVDSGKYNCAIQNDRDSCPPQKAENPDGFWVYILVQK